jgi:hypothetical protein
VRVHARVTADGRTLAASSLGTTIDGDDVDLVRARKACGFIRACHRHHAQSVTLVGSRAEHTRRTLAAGAGEAVDRDADEDVVVASGVTGLAAPGCSAGAARER